jgi:hypothetical protein
MRKVKVLTGPTLNVTCLEQHRSLQPHANVLVWSSWLQNASEKDLAKLRRLIREEGPKHGFGYRFTFSGVDRSSVKRISRYVTGNKHALIDAKMGTIAHEVVKDAQLPTAMARGQRRLRATPKLMPPEDAYLEHLTAQRAGMNGDERVAAEEAYRQRVEDRRRDFQVLERFKRAKEQAAFTLRMRSTPREPYVSAWERKKLEEQRKRDEAEAALTPEQRAERDARRATRRQRLLAPVKPSSEMKERREGSTETPHEREDEA